MGGLQLKKADEELGAQETLELFKVSYEFWDCI